MSSHADNLSSLGEDLSWFKIIRLYSNIAIFLKMADQERMISKIEVDVEVACDDCPTLPLLPLGHLRNHVVALQAIEG